MENASCIFLFDLDGVLVEPLAYRMATIKTLEILCTAVGLTDLDELYPTEEEISQLEACGVHCAWDLTNIVFAQMLAEICLFMKKTNGSCAIRGKTLPEKFATLKAAKPKIPRPSYESIGNHLRTETKHLPDAALAVLMQRLLNELDHFERQDWLDMLKKFLDGTRSPFQSYGTRLFQNIVLGQEEFEAAYGLSSEYAGTSVLTLADRVLISERSIEILNHLREDHQVGVAIYTSRPSLPPHNLTEKHVGYSPESELTTTMAGLQAIPTVGLGMMDWLSRKYGQRPEDLATPNTTHSFAALIAAISAEATSQGLESAFRIDRMHDSPDNIFGILKLRPLVIYIFEDTTTGIRPIVRVAERLNTLGYKISVCPIGISRDKNKIAALTPTCAAVFDTVDSAIEYAQTAAKSVIIPA